MSIDFGEALRERLAARFPHAWVGEHLASFPPEYFLAFDANAVERHLELSVRLSEERPVVVCARPIAPGPEGRAGWEVDVVGFDAFQFLFTATALLTVNGLSVEEARVFTSEPPASHVATPGRPRPKFPARPIRSIGETEFRSRAAKASGPPKRRRLVDVFRVVPIEPGADEPDWCAFEKELVALTQLLRHGEHEKAQHKVIHRFAAALEKWGSQPLDRALEPLELTIDPEASPDATEVRVRARDSFGFLSLTASALSLCGIRIVRADIRTGDGHVDDALWVTDRSGKKLEDRVKLRTLRSTLILIEHFSSRLPRASDPESALVHFSRFAAETMARPEWDRDFEALDRPEVLDALVQVLGESRFLYEDYLLAQPGNILPLLNDPTGWRNARGREALEAELARDLAARDDLDGRAAALQLFRDREIFRTDVRTILGLTGGLEGFSAELTDVAEALAPAALELSVETVGPGPRKSDRSPAPCSVFALGKFGGRELGFASDLELMLVFDDREIADLSGWSGAAEYFDRLVGAFRAVLHARQGATFDLDFRLRPYGKSGAPAVARTLFASYFAPGGPAWPYERQALIKLRQVAGNEELGRDVLGLRDGFVFRGVWPDPRESGHMRDMQVRQLTRPGALNAKFSPGTLVDVEYTVQALQIRYGAGDRAVRSPNTLEALAALEKGGHLSAESASALREGYRFFRALVSALRVVHGHAKDLVVPPEGSDEFALLARRLRRSLPVRMVEKVDTELPRLIAGQLAAVRRVVEEQKVRCAAESGPSPAP